MSMTKGGDRDALITSLKGIKRMNLNVPAELHRAFKTATASEGKDMTEVLLEFISNYVEKHPSAGRPSKKGGQQ
jgi:hypothetical protein